MRISVACLLAAIAATAVHAIDSTPPAPLSVNSTTDASSTTPAAAPAPLSSSSDNSTATSAVAATDSTMNGTAGPMATGAKGTMTPGANGVGTSAVGAGAVPQAYAPLLTQAQQITALINSPNANVQTVAAAMQPFFTQLVTITSQFGPTCNFCANGVNIAQYQVIVSQLTQYIATWLSVIATRWSTTFVNVAPWFTGIGVPLTNFFNFFGSAGITITPFIGTFSQTWFTSLGINDFGFF
ncbi:hypothetical protein CROQUDRAFT_102234 [Cronartium quercuum f. sp. fusiforme G11]|uniref:Uncharacterized protein n=1 Tax=Cronartium quercuum f. sp. fusiforme G11 TaxID=708437 RepID=A0A9P6N4W5_9BASI|nr:hypothetical protein CROQUDRAFT_102234 [Cronartium quercuum f. sp. fusiforme G11]